MVTADPKGTGRLSPIAAGPGADPRQASTAVLMVRPASFGFNAETASTNAFQCDDRGLGADKLQAGARAEFDAFARKLREHGVGVCVFDDTGEPQTPDAVFPGNWVTFHSDGTAVVHRMATESRQREVRYDILEALRDVHGFELKRIIDWSTPDAGMGVLEGTGSLVLDRINGVAYACRSARTEAQAVREFGRELGYDTSCFRATDGAGHSVYHTDVLMMLGDRFAVVCLDAIGDVAERDAVVARLAGTGHEVVEISVAQMHDFAGNMLQLSNSSGGSFLVASARAHASLSPYQRARLGTFSDFIVAPLPMIERYGGGSARCMLAEILLPEMR